MRIKVSTDSVSNGGFWYVIDNDSSQTSTISDLQRDLNNILHLSKNAKRINLSLDNFSLLPDSPISGLIRDGDLIQVQYVGKKQTTTATKNEKSSKKKTKISIDTPPAKLKKRKRPTEDVSQQKRQKKVASPSKSKKRNQRRTQARIARRERKLAKETQQQQQPSPTPTQSSMLDQPVEPPRHLVKKNKNKSKHFMRQMDKSTRSHVVFDGNDDTVALQEQQQQQQQQCGDYDGYEDSQPVQETAIDLINVFGGAFITDSESQKYGKRGNGKKNQQNYMNRQYPVDEADAVFYATVESEDVEPKVDEDVDNNNNNSSSSSSSDSDSDSDSSDDDSSDDDDESSAKEDTEDELPVVDYDSCPAISFQGPSPPCIGDHLAIKTLHLSETYTPEISDWKQVKVLELTGQDIVVELVGPMKRSTTKGLRKFDLPPEHESNQSDDLTETHNYNDVFDMRRLVA